MSSDMNLSSEKRLLQHFEQSRIVSGSIQLQRNLTGPSLTTSTTVPAFAYVLAPRTSNADSTRVLQFVKVPASIQDSWPPSLKESR
jgi:hypothetical protein